MSNDNDIVDIISNSNSVSILEGSIKLSFINEIDTNKCINNLIEYLSSNGFKRVNSKVINCA